MSGNQLCGLDQYGDGEYTAEGIIAISAMLKVNGSLQSIKYAASLPPLSYRQKYQQPLTLTA